MKIILLKIPNNSIEVESINRLGLHDKLNNSSDNVNELNMPNVVANHPYFKLNGFRIAHMGLGSISFSIYLPHLYYFLSKILMKPYLVFRGE